MQETQYEYGSRCGVWRLLRLFKKFDMKFTCYAVGKAVEFNPKAIAAMERDGHEVGKYSINQASHHYRWIDYDLVSDDTQREHVRLAVKAIQDASPTSRPPVGFYSGRIGPSTRRIVWEEFQKLNIPLLYESDAYNDDLVSLCSFSRTGLMLMEMDI